MRTEGQGRRFRAGSAKPRNSVTLVRGSAAHTAGVRASLVSDRNVLSACKGEVESEAAGLGDRNLLCLGPWRRVSAWIFLGGVLQGGGQASSDSGGEGIDPIGSLDSARGQLRVSRGFTSKFIGSVVAEDPGQRVSAIKDPRVMAI